MSYWSVYQVVLQYNCFLENKQSVHTQSPSWYQSSPTPPRVRSLTQKTPLHPSQTAIHHKCSAYCPKHCNPNQWKTHSLNLSLVACTVWSPPYWLQSHWLCYWRQLMSLPKCLLCFFPSKIPLGQAGQIDPQCYPSLHFTHHNDGK